MQAAQIMFNRGALHGKAAINAVGAPKTDSLDATVLYWLIGLLTAGVANSKWLCQAKEWLAGAAGVFLLASGVVKVPALWSTACWPATCAACMHKGRQRL